jgi:beta-galactosidase
MKHLTILLIICLPLLITPHVTAVELKDWENPAVFERNQTAPHARIIPYLSKQQALEQDPVKSPFYMLLDGNWKFLLAEHPDQVPEGFYMPRYDVKNWDNIHVPSNWEMEGFGHPKFRNIAMTIETKPPKIPAYHNPTGCYKRTFNLPSNWKGREILLRFEGVKSASYVWINGELVGYNQGGFEPAEYNITPYLKSGRNDISVKVLRYSDGAFIENQDMWRLSGIYRSVALIAKPKVHIHDFFVYTEFDDHYRDAEFNLEMDIQNLTENNAEGFTAEVELLDFRQQNIWDTAVSKTIQNIPSGELKKVNFTIQVTKPLQWSAEKPNLYTLVMTLKDRSGRIVETFAGKMGFRQTEVKNGAILVNGKVVKFNGVNSHMHHPESGQAVPLETLREDLLIMKRFNINLVRTSHYPPTYEYLSLADELGMYVVCEAGTECHDNEYLSEIPEWEAMFVDRGIKMVYRDRNHASVVFWSAGNEAGEGNNLKTLMEVCRKIDPSRPHWMYGGNEFYIPFEDIVGPRYWRPLEIKNLAENKVYGPHDQRPSFQDEYLAATGNGLGGLDEYWELIWKYPRLTGGAIWDWISPGVKTPLIFTPDASPLKNNPAIMGRPTFVTGKAGKAIQLTGHDDWVEFYRHPGLDLDEEALTIEFWVKPEENIQPNTFITKGTHQFGIVQPTPEELEFYLQTSRFNSLKVNVPSNWYGQWNHITGIYNGSDMELFINHQKVGQLEATGKIRNVAYPVCIGRNADLHDQGEFRGRLSVCTIDELRIYNKALSIDQIKNQSPNEANRLAVASLSFEETYSQGHFVGTGLGGRTYGIIWPDRAIQPEIYQIKRSAQPVLIEAFDLQNGKVKITNRYNFTNLSELNLSWSIAENGNNIQSGETITGPDCPPGESVVLQLSYDVDRNNPKNDWWLTLSFQLRENRNWADAGHEIAWEQFLIKEASRTITPAPENYSAPMIELGQKQITVSGNNFLYSINTSTGTFLTMQYMGNELISKGFDFTVWRAPLANDMDPWGSGEFTRMNYTPGLGRSIENQLRTLQMEYPARSVQSISSEKISDQRTALHLTIYNAGKGSGSGFEEHRTYIFSGDGSIELTHKIIPHGDMPSLLPKTGLKFTLPEEYSIVEWYGRGPFETYPDRKTGAKTGVWKSSIDQEYVPYLIPQDHGNKTDVRWLKVANKNGNGFQIGSVTGLLNFSLHSFDTDNLTRAVYPFQLQKPGYNILNVDYEVTGVGETARRTLAKYRVMPGVKEYSITLKPF